MSCLADADGDSALGEGDGQQRYVAVRGDDSGALVDDNFRQEVWRELDTTDSREQRYRVLRELLGRFYAGRPAVQRNAAAKGSSVPDR